MLVRTAPDQRDMNSLGTLQVGAEATLRILDEHLRDQQFVGGDGFTIADIPAGVSAHRWFNLEIERPDLLHVQRWFKELAERPAFRAQVMRPLT